jgi:hypothetical protein
MGAQIYRVTSNTCTASQTRQEHNLKGQKNIRGGQDKQVDVSVHDKSEDETRKSEDGVLERWNIPRLVVPRLLWNGCLRDNAITGRIAIAITLISRDGVDVSGTSGLGLGSVKVGEGKNREEVH